jgi:hypothetical protein
MAVRRVRVKVTASGVDEFGPQRFDYETPAFKNGYFWTDTAHFYDFKVGTILTLVTNAEGKPVRVLRDGKDTKADIRLASTPIVP